MCEPQDLQPWSNFYSSYAASVSSRSGARLAEQQTSSQGACYLLLEPRARWTLRQRCTWDHSVDGRVDPLLGSVFEFAISLVRFTSKCCHGDTSKCCHHYTNPHTNSVLLRTSKLTATCPHVSICNMSKAEAKWRTLWWCHHVLVLIKKQLYVTIFRLIKVKRRHVNATMSVWMLLAVKQTDSAGNVAWRVCICYAPFGELWALLLPPTVGVLLPLPNDHI